jgi:hypothetical protein
MIDVDSHNACNRQFKSHTARESKDVMLGCDIREDGTGLCGQRIELLRRTHLFCRLQPTFTDRVYELNTHNSYRRWPECLEQHRSYPSLDRIVDQSSLVVH